MDSQATKEKGNQRLKSKHSVSQGDIGGVTRQGGCAFLHSDVETPPWKVFLCIALGIPKGL